MQGWVPLDVPAHVLSVSNNSVGGEQVPGMWTQGLRKETAKYCP